MRPARAYYYVFPFGRTRSSRIAYYFDFDYDDGRQPQSYLFPVQEEARKWTVARSKDGLAKPRLDAHFADGRVTIEDTRMAATARRGMSSAGWRPTYCCAATSPPYPKCWPRNSQPPLAMVHDILADLAERRLMVESGGQVPEPSSCSETARAVTVSALDRDHDPCFTNRSFLAISRSGTSRRTRAATRCCASSRHAAR